jgi:hypothetical protein
MNTFMNTSFRLNYYYRSLRTLKGFLFFEVSLLKRVMTAIQRADAAKAIHRAHRQITDRPHQHTTKNAASTIVLTAFLFGVSVPDGAGSSSDRNRLGMNART